MIEDEYQKWVNGKNISIVDLDISKIESFLLEKYSSLGITLMRDLKPLEAYFKIAKLNNFASAILIERPDIIDKIYKFVEREKDDISKIAAKIGAIYFDLSISFPGGISLSLTFQPDL
ncbi:MAG: hypothetical protein QXZ44_00305 [Ferroplasma sp.]